MEILSSQVSGLWKTLITDMTFYFSDETDIVFYVLVLFLDENAEEETEGGSERLDNISTMGEDEIYGEEVFNQSDNTFEEIEEDIVEVAESAEATRERLAEARLAQDRIAREREKQRRARAARRSVGFVDGNESEHDRTFNNGGGRRLHWLRLRGQ